MKKYFKDLTFDEIKTLLDKNDELRDKVLDRAVDDAYYWVGEYLEDARRVKGLDYAIGYDRGAHFNIEDVTSDVVDWVDRVQADYGLFDEDVVDDVKKCNKMYDFLQYGSDEDSFEGKTEDEVYDEYESLKYEVEQKIFKMLQNEIMYWYDSADNSDLADVLTSYDDDLVADYGNNDNLVVDLETGDLINLDDYEGSTRNMQDPDQFKLPGFDD